MQVLVPPPCSMGRDYTQSLQRRTAELEAELAQAEKSLGAKDEELAKFQVKADILQDEVLKRGMQIRNLDERWSEMAHEVNDLHIEVERLTFALKDSDNELESIRSNYENRIDELTTELNDVKELYNNRLKIEEFQDEEIERLKRKNKKRVKVAELQAQLDTHQQSIEALWACFNKE